MSFTSSLVEIPRLYTLPHPTGLSLVVGVIAEVMPASPSTGGSRQQIRINAPGSILIDVQIFDQPQSIPMDSVGSLIRMSASPNATRALVWERSKAARPAANAGVIVVRKQARIELVREEHARMVGITGYGAVVATPTQSLVASAPAAPAPVPPQIHPQPPAPSQPEAHQIEKSSLDIARRFGECLSAAREALGPKADPDDVRITAKVIYDERFGRRAVA